jgi:hypothetical protein
MYFKIIIIMINLQHHKFGANKYILAHRREVWESTLLTERDQQQQNFGTLR